MAEHKPVTSDQLRMNIRLESIFMPHARTRRDAMYGRDADYRADPTKTNARFVHYTTAEAALKIIQSKRLWMRNTTCMADYREVQHGFAMLHDLFKRRQNEFISALDTCATDVAVNAIATFNQWWAMPTGIPTETYVTSISEHDDQEDVHGRLSMWRAFGTATTSRAAIVFTVPWESDASHVLSSLLVSPVAYFTPSEMDAEFSGVVENIRREAEFLRSVDPKVLSGWTFNMLLGGVTCLKHEGFEEEREWRAIYFPTMRPAPVIESSTEVVGGVPQRIYKIPFDGGVHPALWSFDLRHIVDRVVIGPSPYPWAMYQAFVDALSKASVPDATERVFVSRIPIRTP